MTKDEIKHINFMYNRLTSVHKENPNVDYMKRFKEIIDKQLNLHVVVSTCCEKAQKHNDLLKDEFKDNYCGWCDRNLV